MAAVSPTSRRAIPNRRRSFLGQPGGIAWNVFDARIAVGGAAVRGFPRGRSGRRAAALTAETVDGPRSGGCSVPLATLGRGLSQRSNRLKAGDRAWIGSVRQIGRGFALLTVVATRALAARDRRAVPHPGRTRAIDAEARVRTRGGGALTPNLFAAGGAAVSVSGANGGGISLRQWTFDRDGLRAHRRGERRTLRSLAEVLIQGAPHGRRAKMNLGRSGMTRFGPNLQEGVP